MIAHRVSDSLPVGTRPEWYERERADLLKQPCLCVPCGACKGHGSICIEMGSGKYIGHTPHDDLYDLARCDECNGGIVETCARCEQIDELERLFDDDQ